MGLSKNEAKIFITLLDIGPAAAGDIAEKSKVHRTNVYDAIERLVEKGLVSYITKENKKLFEAKDPENLIDYLKEKEAKIQQILPQLKLSKQLAGKKNQAFLSEGLPAAKRLLDDFLRTGETIYCYGVPKIASDVMKPFLTNFHKRRTAKKIVMKHIYNDDAVERIKELKKMPYTPIRVLPKEYNSPVATDICGDKVALILWSSTNPLIVTIESKEIADSYKRYFELLWSIARDAD